MASMKTMYWQIFLVQRVCCGLGNGLPFFLMLAIISTYFSKRKSLAVGICTCGGATGGLIFPAIIQQPIPVAGYRWIMRALGSVTLACVTTSNILARPRVPSRRTGPMLELAAFTEPPYTLVAIGMFLVFWGLYFASYFLGSFGVAVIKMLEKELIYC